MAGNPSQVFVKNGGCRLTKPVVYVDLDGTLSPSDVLLESCLLLIKQNIFYIFALIFWALQGAWRFKLEVTNRINPDLDTLPIDPAIVERLNQFKTAGHMVVLASASLHRDVKKIAGRLGIFDRIVASQTCNLKGAKKLKAIEEDCVSQPFIYLGDSVADLPIWKKAVSGFVVNPSWSLSLRLKANGLPLTTIRTGKSRLKACFKATRPQQWAKNMLLFLPLIAGHHYQLNLWLSALYGFLAFGLVASATYIWNDLMDLGADRLHPRKKHRPLACGSVSIVQACVLLMTLAIAGFVLAYACVGEQFTGILLIYTAVTLLYTCSLKRVVFVDVLTLSLLYTVRVIAGGVAVDLELTSWLLAICLFVFLSLALVKRCAELEFLQIEGTQPHGRGYRMSDLGYLVSMGISSGFVAVLVLALYIESHHGSMLYSHPRFLWGICPLFLYWIMRIWILTSRKEMVDDPVHFAIHDRVSWFFVSSVALLVALAR